MIPRLSRHLGLPAARVVRLGYFMALGIPLIAAHALGRTAAEALFLANAGPDALPLYFVLVGLGSVPIAAGATRLIDRLPRGQLFHASLIVGALVLVAVRFLVALDSRPAYFGVLIGVVVVEMLMNIQFWVLVSDYFTTLEQKRIVPFLTVGSALGGMVGGGLATGLTRFVDAPDVLLAFPLLYGATFAVFTAVRRTQTTLQAEPEVERPEGTSAFEEVWKLVRGYPIVVLLAAVGFLEVMLAGLGGYLSYTVFTEAFPDERELTAFLGGLRAVLSVAQLLVIFVITRPLVHRMGVGRMNVLFPATTVGSLAVLGLFPTLSSAVLVHANFTAVSTGLAGPVENLTYNAVPPRFLGRVRTISEALLQPTGLAFGGLLLVALQTRLTFQELTWFTLGVAGIMLVLGGVRARSYLHALQTQLEDRSLDLTGDVDHLSRLPGRYAEEVAGLLASPEPDVRTIGIDLAARIDPDRYLDAVVKRLPDLGDGERAAAIDLMRRARGAGARERIAGLADHPRPAVRSAALRAVLARGDAEGIDPAPLMAAPEPEVRGPGVALGLRARAGAAPDTLRELDDPALEAAVLGVAVSPTAADVPLLLEGLRRGSAAAREAALGALRSIPADHSIPARGRILDLREDAEPAIRAAAYELLAHHREDLGTVAQGLADPQSVVRGRVAIALGDVGEAAIPHLEGPLLSPRTEVVQGALRALGRIGTARAARHVFAFLQRDYGRAERCSRWLARAPSGAQWAPVRAALRDSNGRAVDRVLEVLGAFGHGRTLRQARLALHSRDARLRANAVETLASLPDRRFVLPVMDLLEALATGEVAGVGEGDAPLDALDLDLMLDFDDPWIRAGAAATMRALELPVPSGAGESPDMSRLLFLKSVTLFQDLSLDSLVALDQALRRADYLPGEVIFEEGSTGDDFYIVLNGEVLVEKGRGERARELARFRAGEFFGEMALFDDEPRSATCTAVTSTTTLILDRGRFHSLIEQLPRLGIEVSRVLSLRLRRTSGSLHRSTVETG